MSRCALNAGEGARAPSIRLTIILASFLANPVQPYGEGEIVLESADPAAHPAIRMNYFEDAQDLKVMVAVLRRVRNSWPTGRRNVGSDLYAKFDLLEGWQLLARAAWKYTKSPAPTST